MGCGVIDHLLIMLWGSCRCWTECCGACGRRWPLQQARPCGDIGVHLACPQKVLAFCFGKELLLSLKFWPSIHHRIEECYHASDCSDRFQWQPQFVPLIIQKFHQLQKYYPAKRTEVSVVDSNFKFASLFEVDTESFIPTMWCIGLPFCFAHLVIVQL